MSSAGEYPYYRYHFSGTITEITLNSPIIEAERTRASRGLVASVLSGLVSLPFSILLIGGFNSMVVTGFVVTLALSAAATGAVGIRNAISYITTDCVVTSRNYLPDYECESQLAQRVVKVESDGTESVVYRAEEQSDIETGLSAIIQYVKEQHDWKN